MARIPLLQETDPAASEDSKAFLAQAAKARGKMLNLYRDFANRPEAGHAPSELIRADQPLSLDLSHGPRRCDVGRSRTGRCDRRQLPHSETEAAALTCASAARDYASSGSPSETTSSARVLSTAVRQARPAP